MNPIEVVGGTPGGGAATGAAVGSVAGPIGSVIGAGIGAIGSIIGGSSAQRRAAANQAEQRAWEEHMAKTAHWWEAHDLESAGLNRILTATGGSGMSYHGMAPAPAMDYITPAVHSGAAAGKAVDEIRAAVLARDNLKADTGVKESTKTLQEQVERKEKWNTSNAAVENKILQVQHEMAKDQLSIMQSAKAAAAVEEEIDASTFGKVLRWVNRISGAVQGAGSSAGAVREAMKPEFEQSGERDREGRRLWRRR